MQLKYASTLITLTLNAPGPTGDANGRRELNWDAVPAQFSAPYLLPNDFFSKNSGRCAVFSVHNPGWTGIQVFNAAESHPFFSPEKLFVSIGTNDYNVDFFVPGTTTKGKVRGFGIVFSNVALPFATAIERNAAFCGTDDPANNVNIVAIGDLIYGEPASDCAQ